MEKLDISVALPEITPTNDGDIAMIWKKNGYSIVVIIEDTKEMSWTEGGGNDYMSGACKFLDDIPALLKVALQRYSSGEPLNSSKSQGAELLERLKCPGG